MSLGVEYRWSESWGGSCTNYFSDAAPAHMLQSMYFTLWYNPVTMVTARQILSSQTAISQNEAHTTDFYDLDPAQRLTVASQ